MASPLENIKKGMEAVKKVGRAVYKSDPIKTPVDMGKKAASKTKEFLKETGSDVAEAATLVKDAAKAANPLGGNAAKGKK